MVVFKPFYFFCTFCFVLGLPLGAFMRLESSELASSYLYQEHHPALAQHPAPHRCHLTPRTEGPHSAAAVGKLPLSPFPQALGGGGWKVSSESTILLPFQKIQPFPLRGGNNSMHSSLSETRQSPLILTEVCIPGPGYGNTQSMAGGPGVIHLVKGQSEWRGDQKNH